MVPAGEEPIRASVEKATPNAWTERTPGLLLLFAGWLLPQIVLLGPALVGRTVNLPLDLLATPHLYLPTTPEYGHVVPFHRRSLLDLLLGFSDSREFSAKEIRAGRLPLWQPSNFAGAPFANWQKYSPFEFPFYVFPNPVTLSWISLLQAVTCGLGMWLFLRHALGLSYWPAAFAAWCAPLAGYMSTWQGYPLRSPACLLPWLLLLVHGSVKNPWGWSSVGLAAATGILVYSGAPDIGGLVLLSVGFYGLWLVATDEGRRREWRKAASACLALSAAWLLGFALAAPFVLPMYEYNGTGARMAARAAGSEERPPIGRSSLPAVVLPDVSGTDRADSVPIAADNIVESSSGACAGFLTLFWLAPLAWFHGRLRRETIFFAILAIAGMAWTLGLPGFVDFVRTKPLNMLSYNRWVFATADALLVLGAIGLESLNVHTFSMRRFAVVPIVLTAVVGLWCLSCAFEAPELLRSHLDEAIRRGRAVSFSPVQLRIAEEMLSICYAVGAGLALAAELGWLTTLWQTRRRGWCRALLVGLVPLQLFWFAWQERRQADRSLYFPPVSALQKLDALPPGRIWGVDCLPPNLGQFHGREDVRGYDAVDPVSYVNLFKLACDPKSPRSPYAATQEALPLLMSSGGRVKLHPVADLLNVRYLVLRTPPPPINFPVVIHQDDYWVLENRDALPRAFVPRSVKVVSSDQEALAVLQNPRFDPRETVVMTTDPHVSRVAQGTAAIHYDSPTRASLDVNLAADVVVVVSDMWDPGWRAELDGAGCSILRADAALTGLRVPAGKHSIQLIYDPRSLRLGAAIAATAAFVLLLWPAALLVTSARARRKG